MMMICLVPECEVCGRCIVNMSRPPSAPAVVVGVVVVVYVLMTVSELKVRTGSRYSARAVVAVCMRDRLYRLQACAISHRARGVAILVY